MSLFTFRSVYISGGGGSSGSSGANIHLPGNFELTKKAKISSQMKPKKPVLRPPIQTPITCSIHCKNASGLSMGYPGDLVVFWFHEKKI